jgi:hypothetical protein
MIRLALASLLCLVASLAEAAGFQRLEILASGGLSPPLKGAVWYPCARPPDEMKIGRYVFAVAEDCLLPRKPRVSTTPARRSREVRLVVSFTRAASVASRP